MQVKEGESARIRRPGDQSGLPTVTLEDSELITLLIQVQVFSSAEQSQSSVNAILVSQFCHACLSGTCCSVVL